VFDPTTAARLRADILAAGGSRGPGADARCSAAQVRLRRGVVALAPDVILAQSGTTVGPLLQATRTVPIVFVGVGDPVGAGFVESLARPGGDATGFMAFEYSMSGKWLELLKQIAPGVTRAAFLKLGGGTTTPSDPIPGSAG
jgi:ABC transporter substrate binding protein